jgi:hypothetical protein
MNKKGDAFSTLQKAFIAILLLVVGAVVVLMITGAIHPFKNCPKEDCISKCGEGTMDSGKKCSGDGMICCQSVEGILGVQKKKTDEAPSPPTVATIVNPTITINMNDELNALSASSPQTLFVGQVYNFKIAAKGTGSNYCKIQLIDAKSKNKVTDWVSGTSDKADCQKATQTVTLSPSLIGLKGAYELEVRLYNDTNPDILDSIVYITVQTSS